MTPITLLVAQKGMNLLTGSSGLTSQISALAQAGNTTIPLIEPNQVVLSSASPAIGDKDVQLTYPRVCLYVTGLKNTNVEKFRSLSGSVSLVIDLWASAALVTNSDVWIHYYVEAVTNLLAANIGDWGDGVLFGGSYDVQFTAPNTGGLGYVQSAKITVSLNVSRN